MSRVVIVIPVHTSLLEEQEIISLRRCKEILGRYEVVLLAPGGVDVGIHLKIFPDLRVLFIDSRWFADINAYNKLKTSLYFYTLFAAYDYLLTYELDCYVFSDQLLFWVQKGFDYIGAPWFEGYDKPTAEAPIAGVGNSGFSLRNVHSCTRALQAFRIGAWHIFRQTAGGDFKSLWRYCKWELNRKRTENSQVQVYFRGHEDVFWGQLVPQTCAWFRVAPIAEAIKFSFEVMPEKLLALNNNQLPFGCHAWAKYSPEFWKQWMDV